MVGEVCELWCDMKPINMLSLAPISGTGGDDTLGGTSADDDIRCRNGDDLARGEGGNDTIYGGNGADSLIGVNGRDRLIGGTGNDELSGNDGADVFRGGLGKDDLELGQDKARDRVVLFKLVDSPSGGEHDGVGQFDSSEDIINLRRIDADIFTASDDAFQWIGADAFGGDAGELRFANHLLQGDVDGDGVADFEILFLIGSDEPQAGDIFL